MVESSQHFKFVEIVPKSIYPTFGPMSGGTRLSIFGQNLDAGSNVTVFLDNLPCTDMLLDGKKVCLRFSITKQKIKHYGLKNLNSSFKSHSKKSVRALKL